MSQMDAGARRIVKSVAEAYGVLPSQIYGKSRILHLVRPRHVAMFLIREKLGYSFPQIGRLFGRDHSSVQYGVKKVQDDPIGLLQEAGTVWDTICENPGFLRRERPLVGSFVCSKKECWEGEVRAVVDESYLVLRKSPGKGRGAFTYFLIPVAKWDRGDISYGLLPDQWRARDDV